MAKTAASLVLVLVVVAILNGVEATGRGVVGKDDRIYKNEDTFGIAICTYPFFSCFWHLIPPSQCHWYCPPSAAPNSASTPPATNSGSAPTPPLPGSESAPTPPLPAGSGSAPTPPAANSAGALTPPAANSGSVPTPPVAN